MIHPQLDRRADETNVLRRQGRSVRAAALVYGSRRERKFGLDHSSESIPSNGGDYSPPASRPSE